jgi:hypothetical protein
MTDLFLTTIANAVRDGLTVSQIEQQYGYRNRAIRRAKSQLYLDGTLPRPVGYKPKESHAITDR